VYDTSECDCEPAAVYEFEVCVAAEFENPCVACCCTGDTVTLYGTDPTLINNLFLYTDSGLTTPAANGTYYDSAASANPFTAQVGGGLGQVQAVGICTSCECNLPELYELDANFFFLEGEPESACEGGGFPISVWGDAATWDTATEVFFDNEGETPATAGFYYDPLTNQVFEVDGDGAIISVTLCGPFIIITEDGDPITTEDGDEIITE
jgi:hypothetical protein